MNELQYDVTFWQHFYVHYIIFSASNYRIGKLYKYGWLGYAHICTTLQNANKLRPRSFLRLPIKPRIHEVWLISYPTSQESVLKPS